MLGQDQHVLVQVDKLKISNKLPNSLQLRGRVALVSTRTSSGKTIIYRKYIPDRLSFRKYLNTEEAAPIFLGISHYTLVYGISSVLSRQALLCGLFPHLDIYCSLAEDLLIPKSGVAGQY